MRNILKINYLFLSLLILFGLVNLTTTDAETIDAKALSGSIDSLLASPQIRNAFAGVSVVNVKNGMSIYETNGNRNFLPASAVKLVTTGAALENLGADYKFTTKLYLNGSTNSDGVFSGDIVILGSGDPTINYSFYKNPESVFGEFITALKELGIKKIKGNIIGDDDYFDDEYYPDGWSWDDFKYPYAAQVNALSAYDNKAVFTIKPGNDVGKPAKVTISPATGYVQIINNVTTGNASTSTDISVTKEPYSNYVYLTGKIKNGDEDAVAVTKAITISNPTLFFVNIFKDLLTADGIEFSGSLFDVDNYQLSIPYSKMKLAATHTSPQLSKIISYVNHYSDNLITECILKTLAAKAGGEGTFSRGTDCLVKYAQKAGIGTDELKLSDGSGLSRTDIMSPDDFTSLLTYIYKSKYKDDFIASLAAPSESGTLNDRLDNLKGRLWAKTGSMSGVNNLCGYIETADKQTLAFSIMLLNTTISIPNSSKIIDEICNQIANYSTK